MDKRRILIIGGTGDAIALAQRCAQQHRQWHVITSLAGRTQSPPPIPGELHTGGFGGEQGLLAYLRHEAIDTVVDASHPFAAQISQHAANACHNAGIARLQLQREIWTAQDGDHWIEASDMLDAAHKLDAMPLASAERVFLSTGRQELATFAHLHRHWFLVRSVDPLPALPATMDYLGVVARGPFAIDDEVQLLKRHRIDLVISKNSGGAATYAKIAAARQLSLPVIMLQAPARQAGAGVVGVEAAMAWLQSTL